MAVIGAGASEDRSIAALNVALAAARDGARVLMIDADHATHALSNKVNGLGKSEASRLGWLSIGTKASRAIKTANGISILPAIKGSDAKAGDAIRKAIAQARSAGGYDLVILDGPAMPWSAADRKLLDTRRRPRRDPAGQSRHQRLHGRHHRSPRRRRAQAGRRRPQRTSTPRPSTASETSNMLERRANPVGRAATASIPRISLGGLAARRARYRADREFHDRHGVPATPGRPSAVSDLGQWRGAGALFDRADDRAAVPRRRSHQCRRPAAGHRVAAEIDDAAAGTRCDHRPVSRRRPQGAGGAG